MPCVNAMLIVEQPNQRGLNKMMINIVDCSPDVYIYVTEAMELLSRRPPNASLYAFLPLPFVVSISHQTAGGTKRQERVLSHCIKLNDQTCRRDAVRVEERGAPQSERSNPTWRSPERGKRPSKPLRKGILTFL